MEDGDRLQVKAFHSPVPEELERKMNRWLAGVPASRIVQIQLAAASTAALDANPVADFMALVVYKAEPGRGA